MVFTSDISTSIGGSITALYMSSENGAEITKSISASIIKSLCQCSFSLDANSNASVYDYPYDCAYAYAFVAGENHA